MIKKCVSNFFLGVSQIPALSTNILTLLWIPLEFNMTHGQAYRNGAERSFLNKIATVFFVLLQLVNNIGTWILIYVCIQQFTYLFILVLIATHFYLTSFVARQVSKDPSVKKGEVATSLWTSVISSWISPLDDLFPLYIEKKMKKKARSELQNYSRWKIIFFVYPFVLLVYIAILALILNVSNILEETDKGPIIHCLKSEENMTTSINNTVSNFSWISICSVNENCHGDTRFCDSEEQSFDIIKTIVYYSFFLPLVSLISSVALQVMGKILID
jgi:hypothetical protein